MFQIEINQTLNRVYISELFFKFPPAHPDSAGAPDTSPESDINNKAEFLSRDPSPTSGAEIPHRHAVRAATLMTLIGPGGKIKQHLEFNKTDCSDAVCQ